MPDASFLTDRMRVVFDAMDRAVQETEPGLSVREVGRITSVNAGTAMAQGPPRVRADELLLMPGDVPGLAFDLSPKGVGIVLLGESQHLGAGDEVRRSGRVLDVPVGDDVLGRVVGPLGSPLDGKGRIRSSRRLPVERPAPEIMDRAPVTTPLMTGIKAVDALIPIGRGQRQLIVGDRQTGKTSVALDAVVNQKDSGVLCIYCGIGKRASAVSKVVQDLRDHGAMRYTAVVLTTEEDPPGLQWVAPYAAMAMAEHFMEQGRDTLVVLDDLTRHARAYRELSLLLRRPPGREAFPGDIFYIHSRLLERSTRLKDKHGGGSLTALPIVETEAQNISAYIPTNLISITDGQIYLSPELFRKGILPAVDVGRSVSRVGGKTQLPAYRSVAGDLRLAYSQFEELESFSRFSTRLDDDTRHKLERGRRVREVLKQPRYASLAAADQIAVLVAVNAGLFDDQAPETIPGLEQDIRYAVRQERPDLCENIESGGGFTPDQAEALAEIARKVVEKGHGHG